MKFKLKEKISQHLDYTADTPNNASSSMMRLLADALTEEQYHELCHQLHGSKAEFDEVDGECTAPDKYYFTVKSALYRGIFWATLDALDELEEKQAEAVCQR